MEERKEYRLGDFMEFNPTVRLPKNTMARRVTMDQLLPHCRDIYNWTYEPYAGGAKFQNGDTIMARITPCLENGKHAFVSFLEEGETAYGSTEYIVIRGRGGISDNMFVYYLTHYPKFKDTAIKSMVGSSGRQRAQVDVLKSLKLFLPLLPEQICIASMLSSLDNLINVKKLLNDNLQHQADALFKSFFVDFELFREGGFIETELGLIPKNWKILSFGDFIVALTEKAPVDSLPEYSVTNNGIIPRDTKFNKKLSKSSSMNKVLRKNNLVFGMSREILNWGIMEDEIGGVSSAYNIYKIDEDLVDPNYLRLYMKAKIAEFNSLIGMAAREGQSLDKGQLMQKKIYVPKKDVLQDFFAHYVPIMESIHNAEQESSRLAQLRDALLPKLMSGELKIS